jgi:tRNA uridine 5-carboxymethylaminomethyl modification enzyme
MKEAKEFSLYEKKIIPSDINYNSIENLAKEAKEKLMKIKPFSMGQAMRIAGINPTDIQVINHFIEKNKRAES